MDVLKVYSRSLSYLNLKKPISFFLVIVLLPAFSTAQVYFNHAKIFISQDATLFIKGNLEIKDSASINNSNKIIVTGNWINNSGAHVFGTSEGVTILKNGNHIIGGSSPTAFNSLEILDSGRTTLHASCITGGYFKLGILNIGKNILLLNGNDLIIKNPLPEALNFSSGQIVSELPANKSAVIWFMDSIPGKRTIPFGTTSGLPIPIYFNSIRNINGSVTFSTYPVQKLQPLNFGDSLNQLVNKNISRFWNVIVDDTSGEAGISLSYSQEDGDTSLKSDFYVAGENDSTNKWEILRTDTASNSFNMCKSVSSFSTFAMVSMGVSQRTACGLTFFAFPVNEGKAVVCRWITNNCFSDAYYEIERSAEGNHFIKTDNTDAIADQKITHQYESKDLSPLFGTSYYRVKKYLKAGDFEYSEVAKVYFNKTDEIEVAFYPNPVHGLAHLKINAGEIPFSELFLQVFDAMGKTIFSKNLSQINQVDAHLFEFDCTFMNPGLYAFNLHTGALILKQGSFIVH